MSIRRTTIEQSRPRDIRFGDIGETRVLIRAWARTISRASALFLVDLTAVVLALMVAGFPVVWRSVGASAPLDGAATLFAYGVIAALGALGGYREEATRVRTSRVAAAVMLGVVLVVAVAHEVGVLVSLEALSALAVLTGMAVVQGRILAGWALEAAGLQGTGRRRVLVLGEGGDGLGDGVVTGLAARLDSEPVETLVLRAPLSAGDLREVIDTAFRRGVAVEVHPSVVRDRRCRTLVRTQSGQPVIEFLPARPGAVQMGIKRVVDVTLAGLALLVISPLLLVIAVAIRLDSPGPVLFGQMRVGVGGRPFRMWKFRTMVQDADQIKAQLAHLNESGDPRLFKITADPRVTRVGRWLRRSSLDELPQLFNVLRGEMSLVGPRPFFPEDMDLYEEHHFERLQVLPGITGLWQVSGRSDIRDFEKVVELDREYIRRWSIGLDLKILAKTLPAVLRQDGAC